MLAVVSVQVKRAVEIRLFEQYGVSPTLGSKRGEKREEGTRKTQMMSGPSWPQG